MCRSEQHCLRSIKAVIRSGSFNAPGHVNTAQAAIIFVADGAVVQLCASNQNLRGVFFSGTPTADVS